jgi:hypothetical protein
MENNIELFKNFPVLYIHKKWITKENIIPENIDIEFFKKTKRLQKILSDRILEKYNLTNDIVFSKKNYENDTSIFFDYEDIQKISLIAATNLYSNYLKCIADARRVRDIIELVGDKYYKKLCENANIKGVFDIDTEILCNNIKDTAPKCIAAWVLSYPAPIRGRLLLKLPPGAIPSALAGGTDTLLRSFFYAVKLWDKEHETESQ